MKRFYCTICKKMKRVQKWPAFIEHVNSEVPEQRVGTCNRHVLQGKSDQLLRMAQAENIPVILIGKGSK